MKLKLDLHPIFNDSRKIEDALAGIMQEAIDKRAALVEIIPGKGSGALKKSVLRFLDRPDVKARYHRLEKDSDNWGRLLLHFRWDRAPSAEPRLQTRSKNAPKIAFQCFCCDGAGHVGGSDVDPMHQAQRWHTVCDQCGSPNAVTVWLDRSGKIHTRAESGY